VISAELVCTGRLRVRRTDNGITIAEGCTRIAECEYVNSSRCLPCTSTLLQLSFKMLAAHLRGSAITYNYMCAGACVHEHATAQLCTHPNSGSLSSLLIQLDAASSRCLLYQSLGSPSSPPVEYFTFSTTIQLIEHTQNPFFLFPNTTFSIPAGYTSLNLLALMSR